MVKSNSTQSGVNLNMLKTGGVVLQVSVWMVVIQLSELLLSII